MAIIGELQRECFAFGGMAPIGGRWERIKALVMKGVWIGVPVGVDKKKVVSGELSRECCYAFGGISPIGGRWERIKALVWDGVMLKVFVPVGVDKKKVVSGKLDVADCAVTLEEARGVIRRMEKRIAKLEKEKKEMACFASLAGAGEGRRG